MNGRQCSRVLLPKLKYLKEAVNKTGLDSRRRN
jgi:hypothetical protein